MNENAKQSRVGEEKGRLQMSDERERVLMTKSAMKMKKVEGKG